MDKKTIFYGTPLSKSLASVIDDDVGSSNSRKFRLNQQQTVRDAQGRQRFHGAFTGGFSAGYFNTVDSAAGFQPKTFTSQRHRQSNHGPSSSFSHKPEDYMDEEDLGEFGIAPKKIRVSRQFAAKESNPSARSDQCLSGALFNLIQPVDISIGERILKCMTGQSGPRADRSRNEKIAQINFQNKSDFHGLGYKPLNYNKTSESDVFNRTNPLTAVLDKGRKLKISGEAFGSGVLDEDDDCLLTGDMYGYDDIKNYTFSSTKEVNPQKQFPTEKQLGQDFISIPGFVPSTRDDKSERFCFDNYNKYLAPQVPDNWCAPTRPEPRELLNKDHSRVYRDLKDAQSLMSKKFTTGSEKYQTTGTEEKSGLLQYSDLKAAESSSADDTLYSDKPVECATVTRQTLEWRPCSLLCKRFNVPIPFLDQLAVGTVHTDQDLRKSQQIDFEKIDFPVQELASLELKQSIFDVTFYNDNFIEETRGDSSIDSEDEPQIVENSELIDHQKVASSDEDVEVVVVPKLEPEIITLSSSSSSSSSTSSPPPIQLQKMSDEHDSDAYGPPLPPTLKTLIELDHRRQSDTTSGRRHRKKNRKHRKHKRID